MTYIFGLGDVVAEFFGSSIKYRKKLIHMIFNNKIHIFKIKEIFFALGVSAKTFLLLVSSFFFFNFTFILVLSFGK